MKTLKKIKNIVIETGRYLAKKPLEVILFTALSVVPVACKNGHDPIIIPNYPPSITTTAPTNAIENELYTYDVDADDPNGDELTFSLLQAPTGMIIDPASGLIEWTPTDADASQYHDIILKVEDNKNYDTQSFQVYAKDKSTITFNIKDITNDYDLSGMKVKVGSNSALTDIIGNATLTDILEGEYQVEVTDNTSSETDYFTHKAGKLISNKTKKDDGKLDNLVLKVIPTTLETGDTKEAVLEHIYHCIRTKYDMFKDIKKWETCPTFRIYTLESSTGNPVAPAKITIVREIIENEIEKVDPLFTNPTIEEVAEIAPAGFFDDIIKVYWSNNIGGGANNQEFDGDIIIRAYAKANTGWGRDIWMQELTECVIGGGEPLHQHQNPLFDYTTILDDPLVVSDYTNSDLKLWKIHQNRPKGNKDLENFNEHDVNPSTYNINP